MDNYKGFFYNNNKEQKYFEGGAHFKYKDLYQMLLLLGGILPQIESKNNNILFNNNTLENNDNNLNINIKKQKPKTRNINQFNYTNNPNTQITINKNHKIEKNIKNNFSNIYIKSNNYPQNYILEESNKNHNKVNTTIFNYNQKNYMRNSLIQ